MSVGDCEMGLVMLGSRSCLSVCLPRGQNTLQQTPILRNPCRIFLRISDSVKNSRDRQYPLDRVTGAHGTHEMHSAFLTAGQLLHNFQDI